LNAKVPLFGSERKTSTVNCVTMHHQLVGIEVNSCTHRSERWHSDIQTQSTQKFPSVFGGHLKFMNIPPLLGSYAYSLRVGGI
jgi:hypothetical protein